MAGLVNTLLSPALSHKSTPQPKHKNSFPLVTIISYYLHVQIVFKAHEISAAILQHLYFGPDAKEVGPTFKSQKCKNEKHLDHERRLY